jgi:hypothetical protein
MFSTGSWKRRVHTLVEYIKGMGAGGEGYTNLWSTLKGWELEEKDTQTSLCTPLFQLPSL